LKDLDDPELTAGLQQLQENDRFWRAATLRVLFSERFTFRKLDAQLDQIGQGVARLKNIALDMNAEIKTQVRIISNFFGWFLVAEHSNVRGL
jgi:hypothetical protein